MMKRLIVLALALSFAGLVNAQTLKIATIAPETSDWMKGMRRGASEIKERTDGRVQMKLYGGGVQGSDGQVLKKIRIGQLHGGSFTPDALSKAYKDIGLYNMPMVFNDQAEVDYVRERLDQRLIDGLEEAGFVSFGFSATGFSVLLSNEPVDSVDDLKNKKVWTPQGDKVSEAALRALGLNPAPLPLSDVFTGLQTRLIDIVPGSPIGALVLQWHTKVDYMTDLPLLYTAGLTAIDKRAFGKLKPGDQAIVREVMTRLYKEYDAKSAVDDAEAKQALLNSGVQRVVPDAEQAAEIRRLVLESNLRMAERGVFSLDLYQEMLGYVAEYRALQASAKSDAEDPEEPSAAVAAGQN
jgi:TRAP-type C4-dicarboxylate transport system substrate-binding protein